MLNQPTSSPMMTRMFGGRCCCWANAWVPVAITATKHTRAQSHILRLLIVDSFNFQRPLVLMPALPAREPRFSAAGEAVRHRRFSPHRQFPSIGVYLNIG